MGHKHFVAVAGVEYGERDGKTALPTPCPALGGWNPSP
jgi:hypothetical protein